MTRPAAADISRLAESIIYLLVYNLTFIIPVTAVFLASRSAVKADVFVSWLEAHNERLQIIYGVIMIGIGTYVLFT